MRSIHKRLARFTITAVVKGSIALLALLGGASDIISGGKNIAIAMPPIEPIEATDASVTTVSSGPDRAITGGYTDQAGQNVFHNFTRFNIPEDTSAVFETTENIQNVLSLITGSGFTSDSFINGTLGVTGSSANLYLINPSGILFGTEARLNLQGNFTAATATNIDFDGNFLNLFTAPSDYALFSGRPTALEFDTAGAVVNLSNRLNVGPEQSLSLIGGTVLNTGKLLTPGGNITLTATEDGKRININQNNQLLSIELPVNVNYASLTPSTLVSLLANAPSVPNLTIDTSNGTVSLVEDNVEIPIPDNRPSVVQSGELITTNNDGVGGTIEIFGDNVGIIDSVLEASGTTEGGTITVGGDRTEERSIATRIYIDGESNLTANVEGGEGNESGEGGDINIWAVGSTEVHGDLSAEGDPGGAINLTGLVKLVQTGDIDLGNGDNAGSLTLNSTFINVQSGTQSPQTEDLRSIFTAPFNFESTFYETNLEQFTNLTLDARNDIDITDIADDELTFPEGGNITFIADSNNQLGGEFVMQDSNDTISAPNGNITVSSGSRGAAITVGGLTTGLNNPASSIRLIGDSIDLEGGEDSLKTHTLTFETYRADADIQVGNNDTAPNRMDLSASEFAAIHSDTTQLNIGREDGTGTISLLSAVAEIENDGMNINFRGARGATLEIVDSEGVAPLETTWTITGENTGTLSNFLNANFSGIGNLVGGDGDDTVVYANPNAKITDSISGEGGALTLIGNDINLPGVIDGDGTLFIRPDIPETASQPVAAIELGGPDTGEENTINLTNQELMGIGDGFIEIEIGSDLESGTGGEIIQTGDVTFNRSTTLRSLSTIDNSNGYSLNAEGDASLSLEAGGAITTGTLTTEAGDINIETPALFRATRINEGGNSVQTNAGEITIRHGGNSTVPFIIGEVSNNGTTGDITAGETTLNVGQEITSSEYENGSIRIFTEALSQPIMEAIVTEPVSDLVGELVSEPVDEPASPAAPEVPSSILTPRLEDSGSDGLSIVLNTNDEAAGAAAIFKQIETTVGAQFENYLSLTGSDELTTVSTLDQVQDTLRQADLQKNARSSLVYVYFVPNATSPDSVRPTVSREPQPDDQLEVMLINAEGEPIRKKQWGITRTQVDAVAADFRYQATSQFSRPHQYLEPAQQLYSWLIEPLEAHLSQAETNNLALVMDDGLRTLPLAALHDGEQFLIEKYSLGLMPTFSLTDFGLSESTPSAGQVLAMGASQFDDQPPLPGVEAELSFISEELWLGNAFLNENFTLDNLKAQVASEAYGVVHLATHALFEAKNLEGSYIQLWNERMSLTELQALDLGKSNIDLIILSACSTAMGDREAEYGFAGFAINAGSESALASLWPVSDEGTLGFMTQFYRQLGEDIIRSETLRRAQIAMLRGQVGISQGQVYGPDEEVLSVIPELAESGSWDFSHPFYWSAFTMIGNPW